MSASIIVLNVSTVEVFLVSIGRHNARVCAINSFSKPLWHTLAGFAVRYEGACLLCTVARYTKSDHASAFHQYRKENFLRPTVSVNVFDNSFRPNVSNKLQLSSRLNAPTKSGVTFLLQSRLNALL